MTARIRMRDGGGVLRTITRIRARDAGNVLRTIQRVRMRDASGVLRTVYLFLSVSVSPTFGQGASAGAASSGTVTSGTVTATVVGGTAPFTYNWAYVSGTVSITVTSPTSASTAFSATVSTANTPKEAIFRLTVTDATGATASVDVPVSLDWNDTR